MSQPKQSRLRLVWSQLGRSWLGKVLIAWLTLGCLGVLVLTELVPDPLSFDGASARSLLILTFVVVFFVGPLVAIAYLIFDVVVESVVWAAGWLFQRCYGALSKTFRRLIGK